MVVEHKEYSLFDTVESTHDDGIDKHVFRGFLWFFSNGNIILVNYNEDTELGHNAILSTCRMVLTEKDRGWSDDNNVEITP